VASCAASAVDILVIDHQAPEDDIARLRTAGIEVIRA
jgi:DeoR/GlpR family transcriptional regulator of sugar metabolism